MINVRNKNHLFIYSSYNKNTEKNTIEKKLCN